MTPSTQRAVHLVTPVMGKRLIAKGLRRDGRVRHRLEEGMLVIVAGTTNGYVAEEILGAIGQGEGFRRMGFRRGVVVPPGTEAPSTPLPGDVVIVDGTWRRGKTIFDVASDLGTGDLVLKGANALSVAERRAAVLIGHPRAGTAGAILPAVFGRRAELIVPIGVEKRVPHDLDELCGAMNAPEAEGPRLLPLPGKAYTELDAIETLSGASARLAAAGGIYGAEGAAWVLVEGDQRQVAEAREVIESVADEPMCQA